MVELSIGDYILTGGELPAMVLVDTVSRFIPGVLSLKGFLSASVFTACIHSDCPHGLERACVGLLLPGIFLLPALLMLGQRCMHCSVRQLRFRAGEMVPPDSAAPGALGAVLMLLLMASAVKAYVVPYVLNLL